MSFGDFIKVTASIAALVAAAPSMAAQDPASKADFEETINLQSDNGPAMEDVSIAAGKSAVLRFDMPIVDVLVGDPETADIIPLTDRSIYVIGKKVGGTSLTLFSNNKKLVGIVDLNVSHDLIGLKKRLHDMMPHEKIDVRADGSSIILGGSVSDGTVVANAALIAQNFAKDGQVVNLATVTKSQQVMLAVRFAEVKRSALKDVGISTDIFFNNGNKVGAFQTGRQIFENYLPPASTPNGPIKDFISDPAKFGAAFGKFSIGEVSFDLLLDALEKKGIIAVLAEPNLIAVSGETASFLAGGEFPVPVAVDNATSGRTTVTIQFKEFGVRLAFTPTVVGDAINLVVEPEVSELDRQNGIILDDFVIPGLTTRRARTTVDLKNGQSFSIAGMLQRKFIDDIDQMPGIGDVPVLGALARSASYRREDTELAIVITAYLVEPSNLSELSTPMDHFVMPHELEFFLLGKTEGAKWLHGSRDVKRASDSAVAVADSDGPGVDGPVGFVVK